MKQHYEGTIVFLILQLRAQNIKSKSTGHHHTANKWKGMNLAQQEICPNDLISSKL